MSSRDVFFLCSRIVWFAVCHFTYLLHAAMVNCRQVKPLDCDNHRDAEHGSKMVSEVYLTRLLTTKVASRMPPVVLGFLLLTFFEIHLIGSSC